MLMLFTEAVVKSSPLLEESTMPHFSLLNPDSKNLSSCARFKPQMMLWVVSISAWLREEVLLLVKSQWMELLWSLWELTCLWLSPSVSPNIWENWPLAEPSHSVCLIIGRCWPAILTSRDLSHRCWSKLWEREKDSRLAFPNWTTSSTDCEFASVYIQD